MSAISLNFSYVRTGQDHSGRIFKPGGVLPEANLHTHQFRKFMFAQSKAVSRDDRVGLQAQSKVRIEDRRGQQRSAGVEFVSDSKVQAGSVRGFLYFLLFRPPPQARHGHLPACAGHRPDARRAGSLYRKHPDVRPGRGKSGDSMAFFTQITSSTRAKLASFGLNSDEGVIHETI